ncbi:hypothetical protein ER308_04610 [Egibacter rhizosphaerae]|uniref:Uncharacterized protein n=1 Tax=Egibacter rhizosphaerae TaxID=1670831 RepID=A0A411YCM5_9ACTN|nr:hypothetical protein [Egibacter rhizosphaerae]QBI18897.1 hypothetical protein ER308_04610 [Egibacter rhizosphaerae]
MEHLVTFQSAEGREGHHTAKSLDDALKFVERLHNNEEASNVRLFRMHEVPIEFKTYVKVEVGGGESTSHSEASEEPAGSTPEETGAAEVPAAQVAKPLVAAANPGTEASGETGTDASGRRLFSRT